MAAGDFYYYDSNTVTTSTYTYPGSSEYYMKDDTKLEEELSRSKEQITILYRIIGKILQDVIIKQDIQISDLLKDEILNLLKEVDRIDENKDIKEDDDGFIKSEEMAI